MSPFKAQYSKDPPTLFKIEDDHFGGEEVNEKLNKKYDNGRTESEFRGSTGTNEESSRYERRDGS